MKIFIFIIITFLLVGCNDPNTLRVTKTKTNEPAANILVERRHPVSNWKKIINPVGTSYHPLSVVESHWTDENGSCGLKNFEEKDVYDFYSESCIPLTVSFDHYKIHLTPSMNADFTSCIYSVWQENGNWKFIVSKSTGDWQGNK